MDAKLKETLINEIDLYLFEFYEPQIATIGAAEFNLGNSAVLERESPKIFKRLCLEKCQETVYNKNPADFKYLKNEEISPELLNNLKPTFREVLFRFIKEKNISETECYKKANLDRRLFSKIRSNNEYQPRKNTIFALIIGLKLNLEEASELLDTAGYSISHSLKLDVIIEYLIKKEIYDIILVNEILYDYACEPLGVK